MPPPDVIALFGPTAIGKTAIAIELAELLRSNGEDPVAVAVDSMQVYTELPVITGAPSVDERQRLEHRLVGVVPVTQEWDVASHSRLAHGAIDELRSRGRRAIVVGGTGLYLRAALTQLDLLPPPDNALRAQLESELAEHGQAAMHARLAKHDPAAAAVISSADSRRTLRALEAWNQGVTASDRAVNRLWTEDVRVPTRLFGLVMSRERLYARIERRVDEMVAAGAVDEVNAAEAAGAARTARQALGYDELRAGDIDLLKANTRRYAKRQLTWLRKLAGAQIVDVTDRSASDVAKEIAAKAGPPHGAG